MRKLIFKMSFLKKILLALICSYFLQGVIVIHAQSLFKQEEIVKVNSEELVDLKNDLNTPYRMEFVLSDDYLAVTDIHNSPSLHIIKLSGNGNYEYFKAIGREGRGPGEYLNPSDIVSGRLGDHFYVYDAGNRKLIKYNSDFEPLKNQEINLRVQGMPVSLQQMDERFLVTGINVGSKFDVVNLEGEVVEKVGEDISLGSNVPPNALAHMWHSYSTFSPGQREIAVFSRAAEFIEVYDTESFKKTGEHFNENFKIPAVRLEESGGSPRLIPTDNAKTTFIWATSTDDKIFALYSGKLKTHDSDNYGNIVLVFDWDLNVLKSFELDHESFSILATEDNNLYSIQHFPYPAIKYVRLDDR